MKLESGQIAFVTGAASGIGLSICELLADRGLQPVMVDFNAETLETHAASLRSKGAKVHSFALDVGDELKFMQVAGEVAKNIGIPDLLVNNAGLLGPRKPVYDLSAADWDSVMRVNFYGIVHGLQAFLSAMLSKGNKTHVLNTASIAGLREFKALLPVAAYAASKYAAVGLSETMRHDLRDTSVGVSVLCPGVVGTNIFAGNDRSKTEDGSNLAEKVEEKVISPREAAETALRGIEEDRFYIFTHPENEAHVQSRHDRILLDFKALAGVR